MTVEEQQVELDKVNEQRKLDNLEPLDKLPEAAEKVIPAPLDDTTIFAELSKKLGREITSYEDLAPKTITVTAPTEAEFEKQKEDRDNKKISWALDNGKVSKKKYEGFIKDAGNPESLVYKEFLQTRKAANADADENEIKEEFETLKTSMGEGVVRKMGEAILQQQYPEIFGIDNEYSSYENSQKQTAEFTGKLQKEAPAYIALNNKTIDNFVAKGIDIELPGAEGAAPIKLNYKPNKETAEALRTFLSSDEKVKSAVSGGYKAEEVTTVIEKALVNMDIQGFAKQIYEQSVFDKEALVRGIPPVNKEGKKPGADTTDEARYKQNSKLLSEITKAAVSN